MMQVATIWRANHNSYESHETNILHYTTRIIVPSHQEWFHRLIDVWTWLAMFSLSQWIGCCSACITSHQKPLPQVPKKETFRLSMHGRIVYQRLGGPQNVENSHFKCVPLFLVMLSPEEMSEWTESRSFLTTLEYMNICWSNSIPTSSIFSSNALNAEADK